MNDLSFGQQFWKDAIFGFETEQKYAAERKKSAPSSMARQKRFGPSVHKAVIVRSNYPNPTTL
jgi:hypothetical protein